MYSLGKKSPNGSCARCNAQYATRLAVAQIIRGPMSYVKWNDPATVIRLANGQFRSGDPFNTPLRSSQTQLQDILTIRNAMSHGTEDVKEKFLNLLRREIVNFPSTMTPTFFLYSTIHTQSSMVYFEYYLTVLETVTALIIP